MNSNEKIMQILKYLKRKEAHDLEGKELKKEKEVITLLIKQLGQLQEHRKTWILDTKDLIVKAIKVIPTAFNRAKANEDFPVLKTDAYKKTGNPYIKIEYDAKLN